MPPRVNNGMVTSAGTQGETPEEKVVSIMDALAASAVAEASGLPEAEVADALAAPERDTFCFDTLEAKVSAIAAEYGIVLVANRQFTNRVMAAVNEFAVNFNSDIPRG